MNVWSARCISAVVGYSYDAVKIFMPAGAKKPIYAPYVEHAPTAYQGLDSDCSTLRAHRLNFSN
jgi:hypothetical protein